MLNRARKQIIPGNRKKGNSTWWQLDLHLFISTQSKQINHIAAIKKKNKHGGSETFPWLGLNLQQDVSWTMFKGQKRGEFIGLFSCYPWKNISKTFLNWRELTQGIKDPADLYILWNLDRDAKQRNRLYGIIIAIVQWRGGCLLDM